MVVIEAPGVYSEYSKDHYPNNLLLNMDKKHREMFEMALVYGFNEPELRMEIWEDIKGIYGKVKSPWKVIGDFNCILHRE